MLSFDDFFSFNHIHIEYTMDNLFSYFTKLSSYVIIIVLNNT